MVVVGSLLRWRVGGSLPAFSLLWGSLKRVAPEQLAKCYGLGAGERPVEPLPPTERVVSNAERLSSRPRVFVWVGGSGSSTWLRVFSRARTVYGWFREVYGRFIGNGFPLLLSQLSGFNVPAFRFRCPNFPVVTIFRPKLSGGFSLLSSLVFLKELVFLCWVLSARAPFSACALFTQR